VTDPCPGLTGTPAVAKLESASRDTVLLICPVFFSYHMSIAEELRSRGFNVLWWDDRPTTTSAYKLLLRLFPRWVAKLSDRFYVSRIRSLDQQQITTLRHVLVIKGEALSKRSVARMRQAWTRPKFTFYLWDGVENSRGAQAIAPLFDVVATFDPLDARRFGWEHRPLFARPAAVSSVVGSTPSAMRYDWSFIGTLHSDRFRVVQRLMRAHSTPHVFAFGYLPGKLISTLRHLIDWGMWRPGAMRLSTQSMPATEVRQVADASRAIVDVEHPRQRGLTMRTIETLIAGHKLITTNTHIRDSDLYDEGRVCIIERARPRVTEEFLASSFPPIPLWQRQRYSLAGWIDELLSVEPRTR